MSAIRRCEDVKHLHKGRILKRPKAQRTALLRSLARALFVHEHIVTTAAKAKELRPFVEHLITHAKSGTVAKKRLVAARLSPSLVPRVDSVAKTFRDRAGGYTRIIRTGKRASDGADMAIIELVK